MEAKTKSLLIRGGFAAACILIIVLVAASSFKGSTPDPSLVKNGDKAYIRLPNNTDSTQVICLGESEASYKEITKALLANDLIGLQKIPGTFCVSNGTQVLVIDSIYGAKKVRVEAGVRPVDNDKVGRAGYVATEWVVKQ